MAEVDPRFRGGDDKLRWFGRTEGPCPAARRLAPNGANSGPVNFSRPLSKPTAMKKYRSDRKGRRSLVPDGTGRSFDTPIEYSTVAIIAKDADRKISGPGSCSDTTDHGFKSYQTRGHPTPIDPN